MKTVIMPVSKKVDGQYVKQGEIAIVVPTIEDILSHVAAAKVTGEEDGIPVYDKDEANWVQSAMFAHVKMNARNKLKPGTAELKPGLSIPTDWASLCAEGDRSGNGAALARARELKELFSQWANTLGKSAAAVQVIVSFFSNKTALQLANPDHKAKMSAYIEQFATTLDENQLETYGRQIEAIMEAAAADTVDF